MKKLVLILAAVGILVLGLSFLSSSGSFPFRPTEAETAEKAESNGRYIILYYPDVDSEMPSEMATAAVSGVKTSTHTIEELAFSKDGYLFEGWRLFRDLDNMWYLRDPEGKSDWYPLENGEMPQGWNYALFKDGTSFTAPTTAGNLHLYAQWGGKSFYVAFHPEESAAALSTMQQINYGQNTNMLTLQELGIDGNGREFLGWKLYRELDGRWFLLNPEGKGSWARLNNGELPKGYSFSLAEDGHTLRVATSSGVIHAYAQWSDS